MMKWDELNDKEQVRLVLQHVMGCFVLEATSTGWHTPNFPKGLNAPVGFHWPIAFWNTDGECWMTRDIATDPIFFNPLHDMNDAWEVIEHTLQHAPLPNNLDFIHWLDRLHLWGLSKAYVLEHINVLALRAFGVEIDVRRKQ